MNLDYLKMARKKNLKIKIYPFLPTCINAVWAKAEKYYRLLDDSSVYAAAVLSEALSREKAFDPATWSRCSTQCSNTLVVQP